MSKPDPTRYRTTNWSGYNAALRKRQRIKAQTVAHVFQLAQTDAAERAAGQ